MKIPNDMINGYEHTNKAGDLVSIDYYVDSYNVGIIFVNTGFRTVTQASHIRRGYIKDLYKPTVAGVGYIGAGPHKSQSNGVNTKAYDTWNNILHRCYGDKDKNVSYNDCSVCYTWHNFQTFSRWFDINYIKGYELDKDIKVKGNKLYSHNTCIFVSKKENIIAANAKQYTVVSPKGLVIKVYNMTQFCKDNGLSQTRMSFLVNRKQKHHKGWKLL